MTSRGCNLNLKSSIGYQIIVEYVSFHTRYCLLVCWYIHSLNIFFKTSGPSLPIALTYHSMVRLGKGQAILGGQSINNVYQAKIYSLTCSNRNCIILLLDRELSVPKGWFVAIPIPDTISGCITGGKKYFKKIPKSCIQSKICFTHQI